MIKLYLGELKLSWKKLPLPCWRNLGKMQLQLKWLWDWSNNFLLSQKMLLKKDLTSRIQAEQWLEKCLQRINNFQIIIMEKFLRKLKMHLDKLKTSLYKLEFHAKQDIKKLLQISLSFALFIRKQVSQSIKIWSWWKF